MKKTVILVGLIVVGWLGQCALGAEEGQSPAALPAEPQLCPAPTTNGKLVADLVKLLDETESKDTVFLTMEVLESLGADARPAVTPIIRNAERLGMITVDYSRVREAVLRILKAKPECPAVPSIQPAVRY